MGIGMMHACSRVYLYGDHISCIQMNVLVHEIDPIHRSPMRS